MIKIVNFQGAKATVRKINFTILLTIFLSIAAFIITGCSSLNTGGATTTGGADPNESAATVNGKTIKLEEVERLIKQQGKGQEAKLSPLELAAARLQVLDGLIQQEVLFQKAEKEGTVPSDDEVTAEFNKQKTASGKSADQIEKEMKESGQTDASAREGIKKGLGIQRLIDKITGKIEPPKDNEIESFFKSNPESFRNKRGAQLAAIVIDPSNTGEGDMTKNEVEAQQKAKEVGQRVLQGADFATVARENSEEPNTKVSGGDWRFFTEEEMKQTFGAGVADFVMNKMQNGQVIPQAIPLEGKILILKLQRKQERDEEQTLESPGVRQQITDYLINQRKELLKQSYAATVMNDAKIENLLAKKVVENPNELSGARPASADTPSANVNANVSNANTNANSNASGNTAASANTAANMATGNKSSVNVNINSR
ncbi:MAG: SurA N-terminal domain-containing protein [Acidobacteria bacterium]|nr:SurA N-terminal domain-containing protein [Acidobacteriota bacterium]MCA1637152.1 SurA N-terminal domain-containing protein [Acidobacteriota bacterium]